MSDAQNTHTKRWVKSLAEKGVEILLFSLSGNESYYDTMPNVRLVICNMDVKGRLLGKLKYFTVVGKLKRCIEEFKPDVLHAHYLSSYGLLGALSGFHPYIISVWGSDVYDFPNHAPFGKNIVRFALSKADKILSTSHVMAEETRKYTDKDIEITPFGVDTSCFRKINGIQLVNEFVVGNVKTLEPQYGIDVLIEAFKIVIDNNPLLKLRLEIYGKGAYRNEYEKLAKKLGIEKQTEFKGFIANDLLPEVYNSMSVAVSVSICDESFGVVAVEAMACECPVITSDAVGFKEVVDDGNTGYIVPKHNPKATAEAIQKFIDNPKLRQELGAKGRRHVQELYEWDDNVLQVLEIYRRIL